jgi:hypothetical protein
MQALAYQIVMQRQIVELVLTQSGQLALSMSAAANSAIVV